MACGLKSVARAPVVAFVQREGAGSDDRADGDGNRKRMDARSLQHQAGAGRHHDAVDHRDHPGRRQRQLPCARCERLPDGRRRRRCPTHDDEVGLELRRESQVEAAQEGDALRVCDVLDRRLDQSQERHHPHERQHRQQDQRERVERRAEPGHLSDEGQRDQVAGQGGEIDAGATVGFRDGERAGGLQVEVLGGRERGCRSQACTETVRECGLARFGPVFRALIPVVRAAAAARSLGDRHRHNPARLVSPSRPWPPGSAPLVVSWSRGPSDGNAARTSPSISSGSQRKPAPMIWAMSASGCSRTP